MEFHSGVRLKLAKELKSLTWQEIASAVNRTDSAVKKWVKDEIKNSSISAIANYFKVDGWVFLDESLSEEEFKKIIFDPSLQKKILPQTKTTSLPSLIHKITGKGRRGSQKSNPFVIKRGSVLMSAKMFGVGEDLQNNPQFWIKKHEMNNFEEIEYETNEYLKINYHLYTNITPEDIISNEAVKEKIVEIYKEDEFHIYAASKYDFEVSIYEMKTYPK